MELEGVEAETLDCRGFFSALKERGVKAENSDADRMTDDSNRVPDEARRALVRIFHLDCQIRI